MSLLGIDIGTSGCKAGAFSVEGKCLAMAYREYPTLHPAPGWAELDSRFVMEQLEDAIREVAAANAAMPITARCFSAMGEAMTPEVRRDAFCGKFSIMDVFCRYGLKFTALKLKCSSIVKTAWMFVQYATSAAIRIIRSLSSCSNFLLYLFWRG